MRVWLYSALVIGILVAAILWFTRPTSPDEAERKQRIVPVSLDETMVRSYIEFMPVFLRILGEAVKRHEADPLEGASAQGRIEAACLQHNLSLQDWEQLRRKVEYAVDVVRMERSSDEREQTFQEELARKTDIMNRSEGAQRLIVEKDIETLRAMHAAGPPPLHPDDRAFVSAFFQDLDRLAPRVRPQSRGN